MTSPSVGLVLGAGGMPGRAYHAGVLAALWDATGWDARWADLVVGTSAGASAAAYLRSGLAPVDDLRRFTGQAPSAEATELLERAGLGTGPPPDGRTRDPAGRGLPRPLRPTLALRAAWGTTPPVMGATGLAPRGRGSNSDVGDRIRAIAGTTWPEAPTWICAVRLTDGRRVVFGRDDVPTPDLGTAVQASCAVPWSVAPVRAGTTEYLDGALHSPTNADLVERLAFDLVVVSSPMSAVPDRARCIAARGPVTPWSSRRLAREVAAVRARGTQVLVVQPTRADLEARRRGGFDAIAAQAFRTSRENLARPQAEAARSLLSAAAFAHGAPAR